MIVDAHVHVACPDVERFPRHPSGVGSQWWHDDGSVDQLDTNLVGNGIDRAVIVQSTGLYHYDCRCAAAVAAAAPDRFAFVAALDMAEPDPAAAVAGHATDGAVGVRVVTPVVERAGWLHDGRGRDLWAAAAEVEVTLVVLVRAPLFEALAERCAAAPEVPVVLDHCGMPFLDGPSADEAVVGLAAVPSLHLKVTTLNLVGPDRRERLGNLVDAFGARRLCWGSDYPQHREHRYPEMRALLEDAATGLDEPDRAAFLADTARRLFWPGGESAPGAADAGVVS